MTMPTSIRRLRHLTPLPLRRVYDLRWATMSLPITATERTAFQLRAAWHGLFGTPKFVPLPVGCGEPPIYVRPFTSDVPVVVSLLGCGEYDCLRGLGEVRSIVDLGANIGASLRLWRRWFPDAAVIAAEPDPTNCAIAQLNSLAFLGDRVRLLNVAASDRCGTLHLKRDCEPWAIKTQASAEADTIAVPAVDIPSLLAHLPCDSIDLLKCDIEGAEAVLFRDCGHWIGRVRSLVVETHPPYSVETLLEDLVRGGWEAFVRYRLDTDCGMSVCLLTRELESQP